MCLGKTVLWVVEESFVHKETLIYLQVLEEPQMDGKPIELKIT